MGVARVNKVEIGASVDHGTGWGPAVEDDGNDEANTEAFGFVRV